MKLNKGMRRDEALNEAVPGSWRYARDISLSLGSQDLINEIGNQYYSMISSRNVIGYIKTNNTVILFSVKSGGITESPIGEIGTFDGTTYTSLIKSVYLGFYPTNPIIGVFGYNNNNELIIIFTDATQETPTHTPNNIRYLNVDNLPFELDSSLELMNPSDITLLKLCPEFKTPIFTYRQTQYTGGTLLSGVYYYFIQYEISDGFFGDWIGNSQPVIVYPSSYSTQWETIEGSEAGKLTSKSVELNIQNIDTKYRRYRIAFISKIGGLYTSKIFTINSTSNNTVNHTGNEIYQDVTLDELFTNNMIYRKAKSMTVLDNNLYLGGIEVDPEIHYQKYANNIVTKWIAKDKVGLDAYNDSYKNPFIVFNRKTFMPGEIYALYCRLHLTSGKVSKCFHIPGREAIGSDNQDSQDIVAQSIYAAAKTFHLENTVPDLVTPGDTEQLMGYWENAGEFYQDDDEYNGLVDYENIPIVNGKDLRNKNVRHHKFPSLFYLKDHGIDFMSHNNGNTAYNGTGVYEIGTAHQDYIGVDNLPKSSVLAITGGYGGYEFGILKHDIYKETDPLIGRWYTVFEATKNITIKHDFNIIAHFVRGTQNSTISGSIELIKRDIDGNETVLDSISTSGQSIWYNALGSTNASTFLLAGESLIIRGSAYCDSNDKTPPIGTFSGTCNYTFTSIDTVSSELATILGLKLENVYIPLELEGKVTHIEILYAKRTSGNSTVLGQDMIKVVDKDTDSQLYCKEHSFDLISTLAALNVTHAERMLKYDYSAIDAVSSTIVYNTDNTLDHYVVEELYDGNPLVKIIESKYIQRANSYVNPSNEFGEDYIYHKGNFYNNEDDKTYDATNFYDTTRRYTLANFCSFKLNVYNSFLNQQLVKTTALIPIANQIGQTIIINDIYGGDCHVSLYGVTRYHKSNGTPGTSYFWYWLYPVYSVANIGLQYSGKEIDEIYYPKFNLIDDTVGQGSTAFGQGDGQTGEIGEDPETAWDANSKSLWKKIVDLSAGTITQPYDFPQWIGYNNDYNSPNDIESILPIFDPSLDDNYQFPYRVAGSLILPSGGQFVGWRVFPVASYIEMPKDKGIIWNVISDGNDLLVSMKYALFRFKKKSTLDINDTEVVALGSANLFDSKPEPIMDTNDGYIGNQCQFASPSSLNGILFIDRERGKVFLYNNGSARELNALGMTNWFNTNLNYIGTTDNPFTGYGIQAIWSPATERYIIVKNSINPYVISFSPNLNYMEKIGYIGGWLGFHSYQPKVVFELTNYIYSIISVLEGEVQDINAKIYKHDGIKGNYYGIQYDSIIDPIIATPENVNKLFDSFQWATTIKSSTGHPLSEDETISKIIIFTNDRHSGLITLTKAGFGTGNTRLISGEWRFSEFRDIYANKAVRLIDDMDIDELQVEDLPIGSQYEEWFNKGFFKCPYVIVRLIFTNIANKSLVFHDFSVNATPRKRF